jgi:hypothetical protein
MITLALIAAIALIAAPGSRLMAQDGTPEPDDAIALHPISEIIDGDLTITDFANDGTARLPLTTRVPVACTLVYGTTPAFGSLTLDQDMAGGSHGEHNPLLSGLEPETTYYFRVQGVDNAGTIYVSDVMTFTTPPQDDTPVTNLASPELGAQITGYSSAYGDAAPDETWGAASAFDGSPNTAWSSDGDGNEAWIEIELAQRSHITGLEFWSRLMNDGTSQVFEFTVTADGGETYGPYTLPDAEAGHAFDVDFDATTLRFDLIDTSGGNTGAVEIGVYGDPVE